jgi:hypothetical protein
MALAGSISLRETCMKSLKRLIVVVVVAILASGCATLGNAPSYVPSPFSGMHGQ